MRERLADPKLGADVPIRHSLRFHGAHFIPHQAVLFLLWCSHAPRLDSVLFCVKHIVGNCLMPKNLRPITRWDAIRFPVGPAKSFTRLRLAGLMFVAFSRCGPCLRFSHALAFPAATVTDQSAKGVQDEGFPPAVAEGEDLRAGEAAGHGLMWHNLEGDE